MVLYLQDIATIIEDSAPLTLAEPWDNCGWQFLDVNRAVNKVLITLSVTENTIKNALSSGCELIISHHPVIFSGLKSINRSSLAGITLIDAIKSGISIYSAHTNMDKAHCGVSSILADRLNLCDIKPIVSDKSNPSLGLGRVGFLNTEMSLDDWLLTLKSVLNLDFVRVVNPINKTIVKKIAVCGGAAGDLLFNLSNDVDLFLTGDLKYHNALETIDTIVVDANHAETEQFFADAVENLLKSTDLTVYKEEILSPWRLY